MQKKSYIDPAVQKTISDGKEVNTRTMKRKRGRPRKEVKEDDSEEWVIKTIRFRKDEYAEVEKNMETNHVSNFSKFAKHAALKIRPVIIGTDDFTLLRQARRDLVNYSNSLNSKNVTDSQRAEVLTSLGVQVEWGGHLLQVVEQLDRLIDRMHNKIYVRKVKEGDNKKVENNTSISN